MYIKNRAHAHFAMATKMIGDAEPVFDALVGAQK
jgi:hypothetical protein